MVRKKVEYIAIDMPMHMNIIEITHCSIVREHNSEGIRFYPLRIYFDRLMYMKRMRDCNQLLLF